MYKVVIKKEKSNTNIKFTRDKHNYQSGQKMT